MKKKIQKKQLAFFRYHRLQFLIRKRTQDSYLVIPALFQILINMGQLKHELIACIGLIVCLDKS